MTSTFLSEHDGPLNALCSRTDCAISMTASSSTLVGYTPVYDKFGHEISTNPNKTTTAYKCSTCGKTFEAVT